MNEISHAAASAPLEDRALDPDQAAEFCGTTKDHLAELRIKGGGPRFTLLSPRKVSYRLRNLVEWLDARTYGSTAEYPQRSPMARDRGQRGEAA